MSDKPFRVPGQQVGGQPAPPASAPATTFPGPPRRADHSVPIPWPPAQSQGPGLPDAQHKPMKSLK